MVSTYTESIANHECDGRRCFQTKIRSAGKKNTNQHKEMKMKNRVSVLFLVLVLALVSVTPAYAGRGNQEVGLIYVTSQGLYYETFATADPLPMKGRFQKLEVVDGQPQTEFGPVTPVTSADAGGKIPTATTSWMKATTSSSARCSDLEYPLHNGFNIRIPQIIRFGGSFYLRGYNLCMKTVYTLVQSPEHVYPDHPERPARLDILQPKLGSFDAELLDAKPASQEQINLVHHPKLVPTLEKVCREEAPGIIDYAPTYVTRTSFEDALLAAGGVIACSRAVLHGEARTPLPSSARRDIMQNRTVRWGSASSTTSPLPQRMHLPAGWNA
jgi:hypothetical protein